LELDKHNLSLDITNVVGSGLGGHTFSSFILLSHKLFAGYDRGVAKKHGTGKVWEGKVPGPENNTLVLDDVYSNGTSMSETLLSLESQVGTSDMVKAIVVVVNRSDPKREFHTTSGGRQIPIISIFSSSDFI
jgi:orotate phosphoribosyltransferase